MGILYIDRKNIELRNEGKQLCIFNNGSRQGTIPLHLVERLVIHGQATLSTAVLGSLVEQGIGLVVLSGRRSQRPAILQGRFHGDTRRRLQQYRWYSEPESRLQWSNRLVRLKLLSQSRTLQKAQRIRPDCRKALFDGSEFIQSVLRQLKSGGHSIESLKGLEGAAAAGYFSALTKLFPETIGFQGRNRRPPKDPVNSALSLAYTLLHFEAVNACFGAGLDPYIGFYHDPAYNRESLASDLIEPLRARVDYWIWRLFAERTLTAEHFSMRDGACLFSKSARQIFYPRYEVFARPLRRLLRRYALVVARNLAEDSQ